MYHRIHYVRFFQNHFNSVLNYDVIVFPEMSVKEAFINIALSSQKNMSCYCRMYGNAADFYNECMYTYIYCTYIIFIELFSIWGFCGAVPLPYMLA